MEIEIDLPHIITFILLLFVVIFLLIVFIGTILSKPKTKKDLSEKEFYELASLLNDKNLRKTAIERLSKIRDKRSIDIMTSFIDSLEPNNPDDKNIMDYALDLLTDINDERVLNFMITTLTGEEILKKYSIIKKIAYLVQVKNIKDKRFVIPIISLIKELQELKIKNVKMYNKEIEEIAIIILNELTGKNFGVDIERWEELVSKNWKI